MIRKSDSSEIESPSSSSRSSRSRSPSPPSIIGWDSPPSPFKNPVFIPSQSKTLPAESTRNKTSWSSRNSAGLFYTQKDINSAPSHKSSTEVNPRKQLADENYRSAEFKGLKAELTTSAALSLLKTTTTSDFFDPEIALSQNNDGSRKKKALLMVKPGTFEKKASAMRAKILCETLKNEENVIDCEIETDDEFGYFQIEKKSMKNEKDSLSEEKNDFRKKNDFLKSSEKFKVEWWDKELLKTPRYSLNPSNIVKEMVTQFIQHPPAVKPLVTKRSVTPVPLFLTKREQKKARRMKRRAKLEIQAERVRLGLEEPPDARVSMANVMRVLGNTAVADPSAVERQVRAKVEKRRVRHLLHNELRRLNPAERRLKKRRKAVENLSAGSHVAVFAFESLDDPKVRFKIDISASQYNLSGCGVVNSSKNDKRKLGGCVVVEGGPVGIRKFKRMVMNRIDWTGGDLMGEESTDDEVEDRNKGRCVCAWEGLVQRRTFMKFQMEVCNGDGAIKRFFRNLKVIQYYNASSVVFEDKIKS